MKNKLTVREQDILDRNKKEYFLKNKFHQNKVSDMALNRMEIYNFNKFAITFEIQKEMIKYIKMNNIPVTPLRGIIQPDSFQILNHRFYIMAGVGLPKDTPVQVIVNMGNNIGIGNKLPSKISTD